MCDSVCLPIYNKNMYDTDHLKSGDLLSYIQVFA